MALPQNIHLQTRKTSLKNSEKGLQLKTTITLPLKNHLLRYGTVCSCPWFRKQQQEFEYSGSYKKGVSEMSSWKKIHVPSGLSEKRKKNKKFFAQADS